MSLRLIGGKFKNRLLKSPKSALIRPTTAIVRKAVFDICQEIVPDARFLDLCAGTGAMGLEALSRGAAQVTFVDKNREALACIQENIEKLEQQDLCSLITAPASIALQKLQKLRRQFDMIYVDPPYGSHTEIKEWLQFIDHSDLVASQGIVFVEEAGPSQLNLQEVVFATLTYIDTRRFGKTLLHQYRKTAKC